MKQLEEKVNDIILEELGWSATSSPLRRASWRTMGAEARPVELVMASEGFRIDIPTRKPRAAYGGTGVQYLHERWEIGA